MQSPEANQLRFGASFIPDGEALVRLYINGELRNFPDSISLQALVELLRLGPERVAIELNGLVVPRPEWPARLLADADRVEIVHFVGGGG